ncbi:MAG: hypothetical protein ACXVIS_10380 [Halobacteriota archaeon]
MRPRGSQAFYYYCSDFLGAVASASIDGLILGMKFVLIACGPRKALLKSTMKQAVAAFAALFCQIVAWRGGSESDDEIS